MNFKIIRNFLTAIVVMFVLLSSLGEASMSRQEREQVSRDLLIQIQQKYGRARSVSQNERLGKIFYSVARHARRRDIAYQFSVIDNKEVNAMALPNGHVIVFSGLLRELPPDNESPYAFIAAHEISHIEKSHIDKKISNAAVTGTLIGILVNRSSTAVQLLGIVANSLLTSGYSRDMEYEADREGLILMQKAGYSPEGALIVLGILDRLEKNKQGTRVFPTHPKAADRHKSVVSWMQREGMTAYIPPSHPSNGAVSTPGVRNPVNTPVSRPPERFTSTPSPLRPGTSLHVPAVDYSSLSLEQIREGEYVENWEEELMRGITNRLGSHLRVTGNVMQKARLQTMQKSQSVSSETGMTLVFLMDSSTTFDIFWKYLDRDIFPALRSSASDYNSFGVAVKDNLGRKRHIVIILEK